MKKMRRLIPAIAMLLVSAVMLSTASFAWFTRRTPLDFGTWQFPRGKRSNPRA